MMNGHLCHMKVEVIAAPERYAFYIYIKKLILSKFCCDESTFVINFGGEQLRDHNMLVCHHVTINSISTFYHTNHAHNA